MSPVDSTHGPVTRGRLAYMATCAANHDQLGLAAVLYGMCVREADWKGQCITVDTKSVGIATLRPADDNWAGGILLGTPFMLCIALVGGLCGKEASRSRRLGFAAFDWAYFALVFLGLSDDNLARLPTTRLLRSSTSKSSARCASPSRTSRRPLSALECPHHPRRDLPTRARGAGQTTVVRPVTVA